MKNTKRLVLGVISSLLLAAGFAQAADRLDPIQIDTASSSSETALQVTDGCESCGIADDLN